MRFPAALHHPAALWRKGGHLLHPIHVFLCWGYPSKLLPICQAFFMMLRTSCKYMGDLTRQPLVSTAPVGAARSRPGRQVGDPYMACAAFMTAPKF